MKEYIGTEAACHGRQWAVLHNGYFSDPVVATSLVETIINVLRESPADYVFDLGGGTGFLLSQVKSREVPGNPVFVNIDCSEAQLELSNSDGILSVNSSIDGFERSTVAPPKHRALFMMRSVLHYFGEKELSPMLHRLRNEANEDEFFIHQTACFVNEPDAECFNKLYELMRTQKWYPTVDDLHRRLSDSGWHVLETAPAAPLLLTSDELARRYDLDTGDVTRIREVLAGESGKTNNVFRLTPAGFEATLHYHTYVCIAVAG